MALRAFKPGPRLVALLTWGVWLVLVVAHLSRNVVFDDAYMFVRVADRALAGDGLAYNPGGPQVYGSTSLLWQAVVIAGRAVLPVSSTLLLRIASGLAGLLAVWATLRLAWSDTRSAAARAAPAAWLGLLALVGFGHEPFLFAMTTGMDTVFGVAVLALVLQHAIALGRTPTWGAVFRSLLWAWAAWLTRPEMAIAAFSLPVLWLLARRAPRRFVVGTVAGLAVVLLLDTLLKTWWFGDPVPLPLYAKSLRLVEGYAGRWNPVSYLREMAVALWPIPVTVALCARRRHALLLGLCWGPVALIWGWLMTVEQIMGFHARYFVPALPLLLYPAARVLDDALQRPATPSLLRLSLAAALVPAHVVLTVLEKAYAHLYVPQHDVVLDPACYTLVGGGRAPTHAHTRTQPLREIAAWAAQFPAGTRFSLTEHGMVAAMAPQVQIDDLTGLFDPVYAHHGVTADTFFAREIDVLWGPHYAYPPIFREIIADPRFEAAYEWWPDAFLHGVAIRRASPHYQAILRTFKTAWSATYPDLDFASHRAVAIHRGDCSALRDRQVE